MRYQSLFTFNIIQMLSSYGRNVLFINVTVNFNCVEGQTVVNAAQKTGQMMTGIRA